MNCFWFLKDFFYLSKYMNKRSRADRYKNGSLTLPSAG